MILGIDFGTCFSFLTTMVGDDPDTGITSPDTGIPTAFFCDDLGNEFCGEEAIQHSVLKPQDLILEIKRKIREDDNLCTLDGQVALCSGGRVYKSTEVVEKILKYLLDKAIAMAIKRGIPDYIPKQIEEITVTTPVGLGERKNSATQYNQFLASVVQKITGLPNDKIHIIEEPKAAALAYISENTISEKQTLLVYDLGGGTVDVSIVDYIPSECKFDIKANKGCTEIGGLDWDNALSELVFSKGGKKPSTPKDVYEFKKEIVNAKHCLSDTTKDILGHYVLYVVDNQPNVIKVTRSEFEEATRLLLEKTMAVVHQAIDDYSETYGLCTLDRIILVGGASQMPQVRNGLLRELTYLNSDNIISYKPSMAISIGAAIWSNIMANKAQATIKPIDCASHTYGIEFLSGYGNNEEKRIANIILKDAPYEEGELSYVFKKPFFPSRRDQQIVTIRVYEHDEKEEQTNIGEGRFRGETCDFAIPYDYYSKNLSNKYAIYVRLILSNNIMKIVATDKNGKVIPCVNR